MVKKVFYIEKVDFLRSMMEFALKSHGAEIYTIETIENNFYLIDDLSPDLIIFDVESCRDHLDSIYACSPASKLVGVGSQIDQELTAGKVAHFIQKPYEAKNIASRILALVE